MFPLAPREIRVGARHLRISSHLIQGRGSVVTFLDVTKLHLVEQVRRDFVANASHELKTPLTAVRGFAETLLEDDPPEELGREFLGSIRKNTIRLQNLVDDLLDLSRLESGGWVPSEEAVRVASPAREVWDGLASEQRAGEIHFSVRGDGVVLADPQALHQIFRNLYDNALRYTPAGGRIGVTIVPNGSYVRVTVTDSGTGISSGALPRIFERFYRADSGRGRDAGGTGLGLAIVRHLVQSMDGDVGARERARQGNGDPLRPAGRSGGRRRRKRVNRPAVQPAPRVCVRGTPPTRSGTLRGRPDTRQVRAAASDAWRALRGRADRGRPRRAAPSRQPGGGMRGAGRDPYGDA